MLITENQGYKLFCETHKVDYPDDTYHVRIFTKYDFSKTPEAEQTKMELFLSSAELAALRDILTP